MIEDTIRQIEAMQRRLDKTGELVRRIVKQQQRRLEQNRNLIDDISR